MKINNILTWFKFRLFALKEIMVVVRAALYIHLRSNPDGNFKKAFSYHLYTDKKNVLLHNKLVHTERAELFKQLLIQLCHKYPEKKSLKVADLGSGPCVFGSIALESQFDIDLTCVDCSIEMLRNGQNRLSNISNKMTVKYENMDISDFLSSSNEKYDLILCIAIGRFINDPDEFLKLISCRISNRGVVIFRALKNNIRNNIRVAFWRIISLGLSNASLEHVTYLRERLSKIGFLIDEEEFVGDLSRNLIAIYARPNKTSGF